MDSKGKAFLFGGAAVIGALLLASKAKAAPVGEFVCPVDGLIFSTQDALTAHMVANHPGVRIPIHIVWG